MAGKQARCPHCENIFRVPMIPPAKESAGQPQMSASQPLKFACPSCKSAFQVSEDSMGKVVACPTCDSRVQLPGLESNEDLSGASLPEIESETHSQKSPDPPSIVINTGSMPSDAPILAEIVESPDEPAIARKEDVPGSIPESESGAGPAGSRPQLLQKPKTVDDLLPPTFRRALPKVAGNIAALDGLILREPVKKVVQGDVERNIVAVAPEVKARRRTIRNLVMFVAGAILLVIAARMLMR